MAEPLNWDSGWELGISSLSVEADTGKEQVRGENMAWHTVVPVKAKLKAEGGWLTLVLAARKGQDGLNQKEDLFVHLGWAQLGSLAQEEEVSHLQRESTTAVKRQWLSCKLSQQESVLLQKQLKIPSELSRQWLENRRGSFGTEILGGCV